MLKLTSKIILTLIAVVYSVSPVKALLRTGPLWPGGVVRVCWETQRSVDGSGNPINPHTRPDWSTISALVRDTMRSTWGRAANIEFTGFIDCPSNSDTGNAGWLAINLSTHAPVPPGARDDSGGNTLVGYAGAGTWTRMRLDPEQFGGDLEMLRGQVIHETGHALGFEHEWDRADNPHNTGCTVADGNRAGTNGDYLGTSFDIPSIMNFTYDQGGPGCQLPQPYALSAYDIVGVQKAYGRHSAGQLVAHSGGCLNIPLPYSVGGVLQTYECQQNGGNSLWQFSDNHISAPYYGAFVDNPRSNPSPGVQLIAYTRNSPVTSNQVWHPTNGYQIRGIGDTCLDIPSGNITNGQPIQIYRCNGGANQQWRAFADGTIRPASNTSYCLDVPNGSNTVGNVVQLWQCWGGINQKFRFSNSGEILFNVPFGNCLNVRSGTPSSGNLVQLYRCDGGANESWHLSLSISGSNGLCIESQDSSSLNHTRINQNTCNGRIAGQQWDYYFYNFTGFN